MDTARLIGHEQVEERLGVSRGTAYRLIRELNTELAAEGVRTLNGRVSETYFEQRFFGPTSMGVTVDGRQPRE
jgi:predicted transcriptional regulator